MKFKIKEFMSVKRYSIVFLVILSLFSLNLFSNNTSNFQEHGKHSSELSVLHEHSHTHYNNFHNHGHGHSIDIIDYAYLGDKDTLYTSINAHKASIDSSKLPLSPLVFGIFRPPIA